MEVPRARVAWIGVAVGVLLALTASAVRDPALPTIPPATARPRSAPSAASWPEAPTPSHRRTAGSGWQIVASSKLSPGVTLELIRLSSPPQRINVITVSPRARLRSVLARAGPDREPYAPVSAAVKRMHALAGINGYFVTPPPQPPMLVEDGRIMPSTRRGFPERHPRTGVGLTSDGSALFVTADGRRGTAVGMTLREFARLMRSLGAVWAVNLDGGASTTMVIRGAVRNSPSDPHGERVVLTAVVLIPSSRPRSRQVLELARQLRRLDHRIVLPLDGTGASGEGSPWPQRH